MGSEESTLLSYTLRYVSLTELLDTLPVWVVRTDVYRVEKIGILVSGLKIILFCYESRKSELKTRLTHEDRCDERLKN